jgi:MFS family permease
MPVENEVPTLADLLVPSILEKNPQRFDRPWNPNWIIAIGLTAGPAVAGFFAVYNRDRLDRHQYGVWGVIVGVFIQLITVIFFLSSSTRMVIPRLREIDGAQNVVSDIFTLLVVYYVAFKYSSSVVSYQKPRYQLYRSMKLPSASGVIPGTICVLAMILTACWLGMAFLIGLQAP